MCDSGSQVNLIRHNIIKLSDYKCEPANLSLIGVTEKSMRIKHKILATIEPWFENSNSIKLNTEFLILPKTSNWTPVYPPQDVHGSSIIEPLNSPLADPSFLKSSMTPLLLGIDVYASILDGMTRKIGEKFNRAKFKIRSYYHGQCNH